MSDLFQPQRPLATLSQGMESLESSMNLVVYALRELEQHVQQFSGEEGKSANVNRMKIWIDKMRGSFEGAGWTADRMIKIL